MALSRFVLPYADVGAGIIPSSGAKLFFYATGTTTPSTTYADSTGDTANSNPVISDSKGVFPNIFLSGIFNVVLKDANDVQIWTADPVSLFSSVLVENEATDTTCFPLFVTAATGTLNPKTNTTFTFNSSTGDIGLDGNIAMQALKTVDGRDVSVDGARLDSLGDQNVKLNTKELEIGGWNMDSTATVNIAHGLTKSKIRTMMVSIRNKLDTIVVDFATANTGNETSQAVILCDSTNVQITRADSGSFDNTSYDNTDFSRGWITIQYTD